MTRPNGWHLLGALVIGAIVIAARTESGTLICINGFGRPICFDLPPAPPQPPPPPPLIPCHPVPVEPPKVQS